ncbi:hypothetical protein PIB30_085985, partial [Stylosanthes scabra]|nr:hypothetical protein [Stylosanthes scabra]
MMHRHESSADAVLGNIDLLTTIFLLLPVKDLLLIKRVCKKWRYLISDPHFCYRHTLGLCRRQKHNTYYLYSSGFLSQMSNAFVYAKKDNNSLILQKVLIIPVTNYVRERFIPLDVPDDRQLYYYFIRSCNGLLLWRSSRKEFAWLPLQGCSFYISNPTTGHCVRIDGFGFDFTASFSIPYLAFDPWKSPHYKVIFFNKVDGDGEKDELASTNMKVSVYSSETDSWSKHDVVPSFPNDIKILKNDGVYCNGAIHWYVLPHGNYSIRPSLSVYFDIDRLCFKNLPPLPLTVPYSLIEGAYLVECRGNLHLIANSCIDQELLSYDIFELKEDYSRWIRKYNVNLTTLQNERVRSLCVVSQPPNEDEEDDSMLAILVLGYNNAVSYNLKDHSSRLLSSPSSIGGLYYETL